MKGDEEVTTPEAWRYKYGVSYWNWGLFSVRVDGEHPQDFLDRIDAAPGQQGYRFFDDQNLMDTPEDYCWADQTYLRSDGSIEVFICGNDIASDIGLCAECLERLRGGDGA